MGSFPIFNVPFVGNVTTNSSGSLLVLPDLNSMYGNPDVPSSPLYGGGSGSTGYGSTAPTSDSSTSLFPSSSLISSSAPGEAGLFDLESGGATGSMPTFSTTVTASPLPSGATPTSGTSLSSCAWDDLLCQFQNSGLATQQNTSNQGGNAPSSVQSAINSPLVSNPLSSIQGWLNSEFAGFTWGRIGAFALALILIAAGLYLFGSQSGAVRQAARTARGLAVAA
jgi:hypothetical protein